MTTFRTITIAVALAGLAASCAPTELQADGTEQTIQEISNGSSALAGTAALSHARITNGGTTCSGVVLSNEWLLSAASCFAPTDNLRAGAITVFAAGQTRALAQVVRHPTLNVVALRVEQPFADSGSMRRFSQPLYDGSTFSLLGQTATCFGWGFAGGLSFPPVRPPNGVFLTSGTMPITTASGSTFVTTRASNNNQIQTAGDIGGGCFASVSGAMRLIGVTSSVTGPVPVPDSATSISIPALRSWLTSTILSPARGRVFGAHRHDWRPGVDWSWYAPWSTDLITMSSRGDGTFFEAHSTSTALSPLGSTPFYTAGDFNGDGARDWGYYDVGARNWVTLTSNWFGSYESTERSSMPWLGDASNIEYFRTGDFDGDGITDFIYLDRNRSLDVAFMNVQGRVAYVASTPVPAGLSTGVTDFLVGDFDGDGDDDLSWLELGSPGQLVVLRSNGSGGFSAKSFATGADLHRHVRVGDFNGDGRDDWSYFRSTNNELVLFLGNSGGGLTSRTLGNVGDISSAKHFSVGDFDGDGDDDWSFLDPSTNEFRVLFSNAATSITAVSTSTLSWGDWSDARYFAVADLDGDGDDDWMWYAPWATNLQVMLSDRSGHYRAIGTLVAGWGTF